MVYAVAVLLGCLLLNFREIHDLDMHLSMPPWVVDAMQVVLAVNHAGHPYDYTGLENVRNRFKDFLLERSTDSLNGGIQTIRREGPFLHGGEAYRASTDDKGIIDFVQIAFCPPFRP